MKKIIILVIALLVLFVINKPEEKTCMNNIKYCPCIDNNWCPED